MTTHPHPLRLAAFFVILLLLVAPHKALAQNRQLDEHEQRLRAIEEYLEKLPQSMLTYVGSLEESINRYTKDLESGLELYSQRLEKNIESQLLGISQKTIELNTSINTYQKIDTPTGQFFIAVQDIQPIEGGQRLFLQIGNPNYANFRNFTLRLVWGERWSPRSKLTYDQWRDSLTGAQYKFKGDLRKGMWNPVELDLVPARAEDLDYIECELGVESIELETR